MPPGSGYLILLHISLDGIVLFLLGCGFIMSFKLWSSFDGLLVTRPFFRRCGLNFPEDLVLRHFSKLNVWAGRCILTLNVFRV